MPGLPGLRNRLPVGCAIRQAGGVCARAYRARLPAAVFFALDAQFRLPSFAAVSSAHRRGCENAARLPAFGVASARARYRYSEIVGTGQPRSVAPAD